MTDAMLAETRQAPQSLAERAYQELVYRITTLALPPGALVTDKALMAELGIGRTPIREAMQRLAIEGLLDHMPNRGMFVSDISITSARNIYEFRSLIDSCAVRLAAARVSDDDIRSLEQIQGQLVEATEQDDIDRYVAFDRCFYAVLARACGNEYLAEAIPRIFNLHLRLWFFISKHVGGWHAIARAHEEMTRSVVDALSRRQPEEAEIAVKAYIQQRHKDIRELL